MYISLNKKIHEGENTLWTLEQKGDLAANTLRRNKCAPSPRSHALSGRPRVSVVLKTLKRDSDVCNTSVIEHLWSSFSTRGRHVAFERLGAILFLLPKPHVEMLE